MNDFFKEYNYLKLKLLDNKKLCIENYKKILKVTYQNIIIDNYNINGKNLNIILLDAYILIIEGIIENIEILC